MTGAQLLGVLAGLPAHQLQYPMAFLREREFLGVAHIVVDEPKDSITLPPIILLIGGCAVKAKFVDPRLDEIRLTEF